MSWSLLTSQWQSHWNVALWSLEGLQCSHSLKQKAFSRLRHFLRGRAGPESGLVLLACILMNLVCVVSGQSRLFSQSLTGQSCLLLPSFVRPRSSLICSWALFKVHHQHLASPSHAGSHCSPGWPETHCVVHIGLRLPAVWPNVGIGLYTWLPSVVELRSGFFAQDFFFFFVNYGIPHKLT